MSEYILILFWLGFAAIISVSEKVKRKETVLGVTVYRFHPVWAFLIFLPIILWVGLRSANFVDTYAYTQGFLASPSTLSDIEASIKAATKDQGFAVFTIFIKSIIGDNVSIYFLIISALQSFCLIKAFRKNSTSYLISVFLFIASTDYLSWMFNGMRQFIAVAITFACIGLILKKKYIPFIIIIFLVSTIHGSALFMLPAIFIVQGPAWNKKTILFIGIVLISVFFINQFTPILSNILENTQYNDVINNEIWAQDNGTSVIRVLVYSVPTILSLWKLRVIREKNDRVINLCVNMSIISTGIYIVSMFTSGIYVGRMPIYFSLYNYILLPWEMNNLFTGTARKIAFFIMILAYIAFYLLQLFAWGLI